MSEKNLSLAEAYYKATNDKDLAAMEICLHPQVRGLTPFSEIIGKEAFLDSAQKFFAFFKSLTVRAKFASENQTMLVLDLDCHFGYFCSASLMTFQDDLIICVELFYDGRPIEPLRKS